MQRQRVANITVPPELGHAQWTLSVETHVEVGTACQAGRNARRTATSPARAASP